MRAAQGTVRARSIRVPGPIDLLDSYEPATGFFFERGGEGLVGVGIADGAVVAPGPSQVARAAEQAEAMLERIHSEADGPGPILTGAFGFDGSSAARLLVPQIALVSRDGRSWMIVTGRGDLPEPETMPHEPPPEPWASLRVRSVPDGRAYVSAVERARRLIVAGPLRKVVLARCLIADSDHDFDIPTLLERLRRVEPTGYVFAVPGLLGATPELLVSLKGTQVRANPLAGTVPRGADPASDAEAARWLLASEKDRAEHALVVDAVRDALAEVCDPLHADAQPSLHHTSTVWHLSTEVRGTLRAPEGSLSIAARLHPTPAVCGTPTELARATIRDLEEIDRGLYAGLVGWTDASGDGEWALALRCAEVRGSSARLFAGAGIVAGSDPEAELAETEAKFRAMLDALGYA